MTPKAQRIAIAEACGWEENPAWPDAGFRWWNHQKRQASKELPNYLSDLNAIHEAEKELDFSDRQRYFKELILILSRTIQPYTVTEATCITATAAQRAEAFLRTLGKWVE